MACKTDIYKHIQIKTVPINPQILGRYPHSTLQLTWLKHQLRLIITVSQTAPGPPIYHSPLVNHVLPYLLAS